MNHTETLDQIANALDALRLDLRDAPPAWPAEDSGSLRLRKLIWLISQDIARLTQITGEDFAK